MIGGRLNSAGANAKLGSGDYIVVEADESDASFLNLHAGDGGGDQHRRRPHGDLRARLRASCKGAFLDFLHRMPFYGTAILCIDDPAVREIMPDVQCPVTSYGFGEDAQVRAVDVRAVGPQMHFTAQRRNGVTLPDLDVMLNLAGHAQRAQRAVGDRGRGGARTFPTRRCRRRWPSSTAWAGASRATATCRCAAQRRRHASRVIEDYGHHPVEIAATLAAARGAFPGRRLVLAFQPHRYTRTRDCFEDFVKVLGQADAVLLAEVYAAGEAPIVAADGRSLARAVRVAGKVEPVFVDDIAAMPEAILEIARDGDVVMCMGAGSIGGVPAKLVEMGGAA